MESIMQHGDSEESKSFHSEIKGDQELNSHIVVLKQNLFQSIYSFEQKGGGMPQAT